MNSFDDWDHRQTGAKHLFGLPVRRLLQWFVCTDSESLQRAPSESTVSKCNRFAETMFTVLKFHCNLVKRVNSFAYLCLIGDKKANPVFNAREQTKNVGNVIVTENSATSLHQNIKWTLLNSKSYVLYLFIIEVVLFATVRKCLRLSQLLWKFELVAALIRLAWRNLAF